MLRRIFACLLNNSANRIIARLRARASSRPRRRARARRRARVARGAAARTAPSRRRAVASWVWSVFRSRVWIRSIYRPRIRSTSARSSVSQRLMFKPMRIARLIFARRTRDGDARRRAAHARARPSDRRRDARDATRKACPPSRRATRARSRRAVRARARQDGAVTSATIRRRPRARTTTTTTTRIDAIPDAMGHESADDATATATAAGDDGRAKKPWGFLSPFGASAAVLEQAAEAGREAGRAAAATDGGSEAEGRWTVVRCDRGGRWRIPVGRGSCGC